MLKMAIDLDEAEAGLVPYMEHDPYEQVVRDLIAELRLARAVVEAARTIDVIPMIGTAMMTVNDWAGLSVALKAYREGCK